MSVHDDRTDVPDLTHLDDAFARAPMPTDEIPEGLYCAVIERARLERTRATRAPMLTYDLVLDEPVGGHTRLWRHHVLSPKSFGWLKRELSLLGCHLNRLSDLPAHLDELAGVRLEISVYSRNGERRISFRRPLT